MKNVLLQLLDKNIIYGHYGKPLSHQEGKNQNNAEILCYPDEHSYHRENENQQNVLAKTRGSRLCACTHSLML